MIHSLAFSVIPALVNRLALSGAGAPHFVWRVVPTNPPDLSNRGAGRTPPGARECVEDWVPEREAAIESHGRLNRFVALRGATLLFVLGAVAASPAFADTTFGPNAQGDIALPAGTATTRAGKWALASDATAAGGVVIRHPDAAAAKVTSAVANPANYFEMTFNAEAGRPYRLWVHGRADINYWANDSVFVQFSGSVTMPAGPRRIASAPPRAPK